MFAVRLLRRKSIMCHVSLGSAVHKESEFDCGQFLTGKSRRNSDASLVVIIQGAHNSAAIEIS